MGLQALAQSEGTVPTTTLAPTGLEKFASDADKLAGLLTSLLVTALVLLGVLALFVLAYQVVRLRFRRQLVLQDIVNASGVTELDSRIPGLSQLLREQVVEQMSHLADKVRESIAAADLASYSSLLDPTPLPRNVPDQRLNELIASMTTFASDKAGPALQLLNTVLLRPRGTKVSTTLQRQGDKPGRLGMTFEIADLTGTDVPTPMTVREVMPGKAKPKPETESAPGSWLSRRDGSAVPSACSVGCCTPLPGNRSPPVKLTRPPRPTSCWEPGTRPSGRWTRPWPSTSRRSKPEGRTSGRTSCSDRCSPGSARSRPAT
jgi:hypothetical protein